MEREIEQLIAELSQAEPPFSSLGTPLVADTRATKALIRIGPPALGPLVSALERDPRTAMHAAYCLGQMRDRAVLPALQRTRDRYVAREPKGPDDFGVIAAAAKAIAQLTSSE